jgi:hypothetical protein
LKKWAKSSKKKSLKILIIDLKNNIIIVMMIEKREMTAENSKIKEAEDMEEVEIGIERIEIKTEIRKEIIEGIGIIKKREIIMTEMIENMLKTADMITMEGIDKK